MGGGKDLKTGLLLSGGMDSIALAWWKRPQWAVTIDYGQKAAGAEKLASIQVCDELGIDHHVITVDCGSLGSGDMANKAPDHYATTSDWWPFRNQLLITIASMYAITHEIKLLYIGTVKSDRESHLDATPDFINLINRLTAFQEGGLRIVAPAIEYTTTELVKEAKVPPGLLAWAHSCHKADIACGNCRGCNKYLATYAELSDGITK